MIIPKLATESPAIKPGVYEIVSGSTQLYLNSLEEPVYNGWCDDALTLNEQPSRRGKWEVTRVGRGYTIKQVASGLYCAVADGEKFLYQPVVLSCVPSVWTIDYVTLGSTNVRISWSVCDLSWEVIQTNEDPIIAIGKSSFGDDVKSINSFTWQLKPVTEPNVSGQSVRPGLYSLKNKRSGTYVMLAPNEKTIGCWPDSSFAYNDTKLWEIAPLGDGYTIRLHGTNKYCTLQDRLGAFADINLSTIPAAWKIVPVQSPLHGNESYFQIFWAETQWSWDLSGFGKAKPGTPVQLQWNKDYQECRLFQLIS